MRKMSSSYLVVVVVVMSLVTTFCQSTSLQGNDQRQRARKLLQAPDDVLANKRKLLQSGRVNVFLQLGLRKSDCDSEDEFGAQSFVDEWNEAMRCTRCSQFYDISTCDPFPWLSFRIQDRTTTQDQLQRLINTLIVVPDCVLNRFSSFGQIELNVTRNTSPELNIPSVGITQNFNASRYPLLEYCRYEVEEGDQVGNNTNGTLTITEGGNDGDNLFTIDLQFEVDEALRGEESSFEEEPLIFSGEEAYILASPPPPPPSPSPSPSPPPPTPTPPLVEYIPEAAYLPYGYTGILPFDPTNSVPEQDQDQQQSPELPSQVDFALQNSNINCTLVLQAIDVANVSEIESNIGCIGCIQFEECESGRGINGTVDLDQSASSNETQNFIISFWREIICAIADPSDQNATVQFGELPQPLLIPDWNPNDEKQCEGTASFRRKSKVSDPDREPIENISYNVPEGVQPTGPTTNDGNGEDDNNNDGFAIWVPIVAVASIIILVIILALLVIRRRQTAKEAGVVGYPISPSPIATPVSGISSAGRQAALLARAEQFGYQPTFR